MAAMAAPVLVFDDLLPRGRRAPAADPCSLLLHTTGRRGDVVEQVVLADAELCLDVAASGDTQALAPLVAMKPGEIRLPWSMCRPDDMAALLRALRTLGYDADIVVGTPDGNVPQAVGDLDLRALSPAELPRVVLDDYGSLTRELLLNGVLVTQEPPLFCVRPGRIYWDGDIGRVLAALDAHLEQCREIFGRIPGRALDIVLDGAEIFTDRSALAALIEGIDQRGLLPIAVLYRGDGGDPAALLRALTLAFRWRLSGADMRCEVLDVAEPLLAAAAPQGGMVDVDALRAVRQRWQARPDAASHLRRADDLVRRAVFAALATPTARQDVGLMHAARSVLGPAGDWIRGFRSVAAANPPVLAVVPTWQCELRCRYCTIPKQDGRVMPRKIMDGAIELLLSSDADAVRLHFFGGEPLLEWDLIQHAIDTGERRAAACGSTIEFQITTNGFALSEAMLDELAAHDVHMQLSFDGDAQTQHDFRRSLIKGRDPYVNSPALRHDWLSSRAISHAVIQVVHPDNADRMVDNFEHILGLGYRLVQINYAIGANWPDHAIEAYAAGLQRIGEIFERRWADGEELDLVNLREDPRRIRVNTHPTVDWDGTVLSGNGFLFIPQARQTFRLGHLDDMRCYQRYVADGLGDDAWYDNWAWPGTVDNNRQIGAVLTSFVRWMRGRHPDRYS